MHTADHERIAGVAAKKWSFFERSPGGYLILSALAGIYLGLGLR
jgi:nitrite transporter NirC